jgi:protein involved in polysaccharide export with SLBB domain
LRPGDALCVGYGDLLAPGVMTWSKCTVGPDGTIVVPVLGHVRVAGLAVEEVGPRLQDLVDRTTIHRSGPIFAERPDASGECKVSTYWPDAIRPARPAGTVR